MLDFYLEIDEFLIWNFNITSNGELLAACFVMGLLAFGYEGTRILRLILLCRAEEKTTLFQNGETTQLRNGHVRRSNCFADWMGYNTIQSTLHVVQAIQNYTLMLAVMTFNAWLLVSVILGAAIGFYLMAPFSPQLTQQINHRGAVNSRLDPGVRDYSSTRETPRDCPSIKFDEETRFFDGIQQDARY